MFLDHYLDNKLPGYFQICCFLSSFHTHRISLKYRERHQNTLICFGALI